MAIFGRRAQTVQIPLGDLADEDLMVRYAAGDVASFEVLLERHRTPVFNFVLRSCRRKDVAEELLQEIFLRVVKQAGGYKRKAKFTTWLYTIARNLCIDHARRMTHRQEKSLDEPAGGRSAGDTTGAPLVSLVPDKGSGPESLLADRQFAGALYEALDELPEEQREVFLMRERQNLKFREIAQIVGVPENTVKSRMRYALEYLRERLQEFQAPAQVLK